MKQLVKYLAIARARERVPDQDDIEDIADVATAICEIEFNRDIVVEIEDVLEYVK